MKRRDFITLLGGAAARGRSRCARRGRKLATVGFLGTGTGCDAKFMVRSLRRTA